MKVCIGGTFNIIHIGHELLFETAFSVGDAVEVGLTTDEFARCTKNVPVRSYDERKRDLDNFLRRYGKPFEIVGISDPLGTAVTSGTVEGIVVSPETRTVADRINRLRQENGKNPLKVFCIREVRADDRTAISASRIVSGEIDRDGRLKEPVRVAVATRNEVKVNAVRNVFTQIFGLVEMIEVPTDEVSRQPIGEETIQGSIERARSAIELTNADFGVGIEAGLIYVGALDKHLDVQYCTVVDSTGRVTYGHGPGFQYPPEVADAALSGRPIGEVMSRLTGIENIGHRGGSVGYLSGGIIDRTSLTEIAVLMALIPRIRVELYDDAEGGHKDSTSDAACR
ncbi:MAG TPA: inosine/xanthosine triphosphatase [Thermoplasmata archaeon]|nr:inosine/xanthosine triphosphatase [Thermoplasmata archaeon]